jgi:hypothetical protein
LCFFAYILVITGILIDACGMFKYKRCVPSLEPEKE